MNWVRLLTRDRELLGQLLLPDDALRNGHHATFHSCERMPISWELAQSVPDTVPITTVVLNRGYDGDVYLARGTIEQLEGMPQVRFFPSYGLVSGKVKP